MQKHLSIFTYWEIIVLRTCNNNININNILVRSVFTVQMLTEAMLDLTLRNHHKTCQYWKLLSFKPILHTKSYFFPGKHRHIAPQIPNSLILFSMMSVITVIFFYLGQWLLVVQGPCRSLKKYFLNLSCLTPFSS